MLCFETEQMTFTTEMLTFETALMTLEIVLMTFETAIMTFENEILGFESEKMSSETELSGFEMEIMKHKTQATASPVKPLLIPPREKTSQCLEISSEEQKAPLWEGLGRLKGNSTAIKISCTFLFMMIFC